MQWMYTYVLLPAYEKRTFAKNSNFDSVQLIPPPPPPLSKIASKGMD